MTDIKTIKRSKFLNNSISSAVVQIKIEQIRPNRAQPRIEFDNNSIIRLADSIRRYGILQPLSVRKAENDDFYEFELIAGERRLRAARSLGYQTVPCVIIEADEKLSAELAIIENLLRENLNMFEQAYGFRQLIENYSMTQDDVARKLSLSQSAVANKLRLLRLSYDEQRLIVELGLTERHARALLKVEDQQTRIDIIKFISANKLNVASAEQYIEELLKTLNCRSDDEKKLETAQKLQEKRPFADMISSFERKVEAIKKIGRNASIDIIDNETEVELRILISK